MRSNLAHPSSLYPMTIYIISIYWVLPLPSLTLTKFIPSPLTTPTPFPHQKQQHNPQESMIIDNGEILKTTDRDPQPETNNITTLQTILFTKALVYRHTDSVVVIPNAAAVDFHNKAPRLSEWMAFAVFPAVSSVQMLLLVLFLG